MYDRLTVFHLIENIVNELEADIAEAKDPIIYASLSQAEDIVWDHWRKFCDEQDN